MSKNLFFDKALSQIPKILTLLDRNPHSPTYGCFDRNFWHYKIIDFPSGMAQEFVLPLALVYGIDDQQNQYYKNPRIKEFVKAGIAFAASSSHADGSCDDYFPFEKAGGAAAFSLLACLDSYMLLGLENKEFLQFFEKRATWLANHDESGQLANHQALIVLCLELISRIQNTDKFDELIKTRLDRVLSWQSSEGWFQEYEGADPGYHTLTISILARVYELNPSEKLKGSLKKAVEFAAQFVHPDGSYGGEYGSRNTYNYFPHGFELVGKWMPEALSVNDRYLKGLENNLEACFEDDHVIAHHVWNYLLAWKDYVDDRPETVYPKPGRVWFKEARILIDRRNKSELYAALNKGGVFKLFRDDELVVSDTQFSLLLKNGSKTKNAVAHLIDDTQIDISDSKISVKGNFGWANHTQASPWKLVIFRIGMLTVGRFFPDLIRKILQKILITGKKEAPFKFERTFEYDEGSWIVKDELQAKNWAHVESAGIDSSQTSIYVVMSRTFQKGQLKPWLDFTEDVHQLDNQETLSIKRMY